MRFFIYAIMFLLIVLCCFLYPQELENGYNPLSQAGEPIRAYLNLNNVSTIFKNDGISDIDAFQQNSGFVFPKGTGKLCHVSWPRVRGECLFRAFAHLP